MTRTFWLPLLPRGVDVSSFLLLLYVNLHCSNDSASHLDCKSLAPTWETLANDFALESNVVIAKVDAEAENSRALTKEQGVTGYPTIKFFAAGSSEAETYSGGRSEESLIEFLNTKSGTHRAVGGGLDRKAGTITALEKLVAEYVPTHKFEKLAAEIKKVAKGLQDKYAQYYIKVADKLSQNENYASKELTRLLKVLGKGGSAPEKVDDLVSRSNILRAFAGENEETTEHKDEL